MNSIPACNGKRNPFCLPLCCLFLTIMCVASTTPTAYAQASSRIAAEAKLQVFTQAGITVTADSGSYPLTFLDQEGGGTVSPNFTNNVSSGGITTGLVLELQTGNGPDPSRAAASLLFTPTVTLTNTTDSFQPYSFQYDVSFGSFVNASPNGGSALAEESVNIVLSATNTGVLSNFNQSLLQTDGLLQDNNPPPSVGGSNGIAPMSAITFFVQTSITADTRYTPASPLATPEPGMLGILVGFGFSVVSFTLRRRRRGL